MGQEKFIRFKQDISGYELPSQFTFPFYYQPHPLCKLACEELQSYIQEQTDWNHNFGSDDNPIAGAIGKMFGVLLVNNSLGQIGYLAAYSGKLANSNEHKKFVPPIFDLLDRNNFYQEEEEELNTYNRAIESLEGDTDYAMVKKALKIIELEREKGIKVLKENYKQGKADRKKIRKEQIEVLDEKAYAELMNELSKASVDSHYMMKFYIKEWDDKVQKVQDGVDVFESKIKELKETRKRKSNTLQKRVFSEYKFLNIEQKEKGVLEIFAPTFFKIPPAGAGECAAPKLLQHAFIHGFTPIALAEFWWGQSPKSEIRKQGTYYPACKGKCEPILGHMLKGMNVEDNPLLRNPGADKKFSIFYEDEAIAIVNKPHEFLSVPGKNIEDSVLSRLRFMYPNAIGPLLLHRLDMSTSGILVVAKTERYHRFIQKQFIDRTIKKRYVATLDGIVEVDRGIIDLPLRGDFYDRPKQLVCHEHGKSSITEWELIEIKDGKSKVYFYPKTGRTHQLRVHAAHKEGLGIPIVGDDLYGRKDIRLHLHAESITLLHPVTKKYVSFTIPAEF